MHPVARHQITLPTSVPVDVCFVVMALNMLKRSMATERSKVFSIVKGEITSR
jgi:hypothetical protein